MAQERRDGGRGRDTVQITVTNRAPLANGQNVSTTVETALPIKCAATIREALGRDPERPARFNGIEQLPRRVQVMPADAAGVKAFVAENCE